MKDYRCGLRGPELTEYCANEGIKTIGIVYGNIGPAESASRELAATGVAMHGWCHINPDRPNYRLLDDAMRANLLHGLYIDPVAAKYYIDAEIVGKAFEIATYNDLPVMINTDDRDPLAVLNTQPYLIATIAVLFPTVPIVIAHGGVTCHSKSTWEYWRGEDLVHGEGEHMARLAPRNIFMHCCEMVRDTHNIFVDLSTMDSSLKANVLSMYLQDDINDAEDIETLLNKLVISSYSVNGHVSLTTQIASMAEVGISDEHITRILANEIPRRV
jgi:hypothetical protein